MKSAIAGLGLIFCLAWLEPLRAADDPASQVGFYLRHYGGRVDPRTLPQVYRVFEAVRAVADKNAKRWPQLVVVRDLPADRILALPDAHIVVPAKAVDLLYRGVDGATGDARLAFVLGHELAHMAEDDFWDADMARTLSGRGADLQALLAGHGGVHALVAKETKADDDGFLYAALAGYEVYRLLGDGEGADFLSEWVERTGAAPDAAHAAPAARARVLRLRLAERLEQLELFHMGVRLAHFGRCDDALRFFEAFQPVFPSRELFNDVGFCRLQQALEAMPVERAALYWLPQVLDAESRLGRIPAAFSGPQTLRGAGDSPADEFLSRAVRAFEAAAERDPFYLPALVNLAATRFLQGEVYQARAAVEQARKLASEDVGVLTLRALILYEEGLEMDLGPDVIGLLDRLLQQSGSPMVRYNLARLLDQRGRAGTAARHWAVLAAAAASLPTRMIPVVCERAGVACAPAPAAAQPAWPPPLPIGADLFADDGAAARLRDWRRIPFDWSGDPGMRGNVRLDSGASVLEIDGIVEMVAYTPPASARVEVLQAGSGTPRSRRDLRRDEVWSYGGWAARVAGGRVREIWVSGRD